MRGTSNPFDRSYIDIVCQCSKALAGGRQATSDSPYDGARPAVSMHRWAAHPLLAFQTGLAHLVLGTASPDIHLAGKTAICIGDCREMEANCTESLRFAIVAKAPNADGTPQG